MVGHIAIERIDLGGTAGRQILRGRRRGLCHCPAERQRIASSASTSARRTPSAAATATHSPITSRIRRCADSSSTSRAYRCASQRRERIEDTVHHQLHPQVDTDVGRHRARDSRAFETVGDRRDPVRVIGVAKRPPGESATLPSTRSPRPAWRTWPASGIEQATYTTAASASRSAADHPCHVVHAVLQSSRARPVALSLATVRAPSSVSRLLTQNRIRSASLKASGDVLASIGIHVIVLPLSRRKPSRRIESTCAGRAIRATRAPAWAMRAPNSSDRAGAEHGDARPGGRGLGRGGKNRVRRSWEGRDQVLPIIVPFTKLNFRRRAFAPSTRALRAAAAPGLSYSLAGREHAPSSRY